MIQWINDIGHLWAGLFLPALIQNTLFLVLIWGMLHLLRKAPPRIKFILCILAFVKLLIPPFLTLPEKPAALISYVYQGSFPGDSGALTLSTAFSAHASAGRPDSTGLIFLIWIAGSAGFLIHAFALTLRLQRSLTRVQHVTSFSGIPVFTSADIAVPMTTGLFKPRVIVPSSWESWSRESRDLILRHELAHITRKDAWSQLLQIVVQSLYFFHPLVWKISEKINMYREMACDDFSTRSHRNDSIKYARVLIKIAESLTTNPLDCPSASALIRRKNNLLNRVHYQMEDKPMTPSIRRISLLFTLFSILAVATSWESAYSRVFPALKEGEQAVKLRIVKDGSYQIDGKNASQQNLKEHLLEKQNASDQNIVILIDAGSGIKMPDLLRVETILRDLELLQVIYQGQIRFTLPPLPQSGVFTPFTKKIPDKFLCTIHLGKRGGISVDDSPATLSDVSGKVKARFIQNPNVVVAVMPHMETTYKEYVNVLREIKDSGVQRIAVNTTLNL